MRRIRRRDRRRCSDGRALAPACRPNRRSGARPSDGTTARRAHRHVEIRERQRMSGRIPRPILAAPISQVDRDRSAPANGDRAHPIGESNRVWHHAARLRGRRLDRFTTNGHTAACPFRNRDSDGRLECKARHARFLGEHLRRVGRRDRGDRASRLRAGACGPHRRAVVTADDRAAGSHRHVEIRD